MNLSLLYSGLLHILVFSLLFFCMQGQSQNNKKPATYTIDFIGSSAGPMRYGAPQEQAAASVQQAVQEAAPAEQPKAEVKEKTQIKTAKPKETKKPAYNSEAQITKEKQKDSVKTTPEPAAEEKVVLAKPSILKEVQTGNIDVSGEHNLIGGGTGAPGERAVQASFTNFPYPWYITQVRNNLWTSWQKLMPKKTVGLSVVVSFNIDKNGAVYGVQIDKSSKNDDFDYKGRVAVLNSAPYPPLPQDYGKDILTVSVEFKNEE